MRFDLCVIDWTAIYAIVAMIISFLTFIAICMAFRSNKIAERALKENAHQRKYEHISSIYNGLLETLAKLKFSASYIGFHIEKSFPQKGVKITRDDYVKWAKMMKDGDDATRLHRDAKDISYSDNVKSLIEQILAISWPCFEDFERIGSGSDLLGITLNDS